MGTLLLSKPLSQLGSTMIAGGAGLSLTGYPISPFQLQLQFRSSANGAPQSFFDGCNAAAALLMTAIRDPITVYISVGYNEDGTNFNLGTGGSSPSPTTASDTYTNLRAALLAKASVPSSYSAALPAGSTIGGASNMNIPQACAKALGLSGVAPRLNFLDGSTGIGSGVPTGALVGVCLHEFTHCLGRVNGLQPFDFGRFTSSGTRLLFGSGSTAVASYFSIDNGVTDLADYGQTSDPADFLSTGGSLTPNDPFNETYSNGSTLQTLTAVDKQLLTTLGFTVV